MRRDMGILELLRVIGSNWVAIFLCALLGAGATYFVCLKIKPWYGYSILMRIPAYKFAPNDTSKVVEILGKPTLLNKDIKSEISAYLDFHYFENPTYKEPEDRVKFLNKTNGIGDTELMEIIGWGRTPAIAEEFTGQVAQDLKRFFDPRVEKAIVDRNTSFEMMEREIKNIQNRINVIDYSLKKVGFSMILMQEKSTLQIKAFELMRDRKLLEVRSGGDNLRPLTVVAKRIVSAGPVFPRKELFSAIGGILGLLIGITMTLTSVRFKQEDSSSEEDYFPHSEPQSENQNDRFAA